MREIQTEIRRDHIENDNRKNELQSKAQSGLKTANTHSDNDAPINEPVRNNTFNQPQGEHKQTADTPPKFEKLDLGLNTDTMLGGDFQQGGAAEKAVGGIETAVSGDGGHENLKDFNSFDSRAVMTSAFYTASKSDKKEQIAHRISADTGIQNQITHQSIENAVKRNVIQNKSEIGIKTAKADKVAKIKENAKSGYTSARFAGVFKTAATAGSAAASFISEGVPIGESDDLASGSASSVKKAAGSVVEKPFEYITSFAGNKAKTVKASDKRKGGHSRIYNMRVNLSERITEHIKPLKFVRNKARTIKRRTVKSVNNLKVVKAVKKLNSIKVEDIIKGSKAFKAFNTSKAVKAVKKLNSIRIGSFPKSALNGADKVKSAVNAGAIIGTAVKGVSSAVNTVQQFKGLSQSGDIGSDLAEQTKEMTGKAAEKAAHLSKKTVSKISKSVKTAKKAAKPAKRTMRTASKKALKTSAKATAQAAKATAKTAQKSAELSVKIGAKIVSGIANAIGSLMASPAGPIVLIIVLAVVLVVVIFNLISGAVQVPATVVSGAGSSLSWLFEDDSRADDDIADIYADFEDAAKQAMADARSHYKNEVGSISFGDRDSIVLNGASFYPASSADSFIQSFFDGIEYDDYVYLCEICYIKKLRDERAAQGLSESVMPEITLEKEDILNFLIDYCYDFDITIEYNQTCPTTDCQQGEDTQYHYNVEECPNVDEFLGRCSGHPYTYTYCDRSHIKAIITIQQRSKDVLENVVLVLSDEEKNLLDTGLELLNESLQP